MSSGIIQTELFSFRCCHWSSACLQVSRENRSLHATLAETFVESHTERERERERICTESVYGYQSHMHDLRIRNQRDEPVRSTHRPVAVQMVATKMIATNGRRRNTQFATSEAPFMRSHPLRNALYRLMMIFCVKFEQKTDERYVFLFL